MTRLLILYLLLEGDRSAYEIKQTLSSPYVAHWFRIEDASIYSALKTLTKNGFATSKQVGRATRYRISRKGTQEYEMALAKAWEAGEGRSFDAALAASGDLPKEELSEFFALRLTYLQGRLAQFTAVKDGAMSAMLARREQMALECELSWLERERQGLANAEQT